MAARDGSLQLAVINDAASLGIDEEHAAGLQTALLDDPLRLNGDGTNFRGADNAVIIHDVEAAGAKTVTVEVGTAEAAVGEGEQRRAVPGLHLAGSPLVEGGLLGVHQVVALPGLGDHKHDRLGEGEDAVDGEQLEHVVEGGRVGTARLDDGVQHLQLVAEDVRLHDTLTGAHPVLVAAEGVDLTCRSRSLASSTLSVSLISRRLLAAGSDSLLLRFCLPL